MRQHSGHEGSVRGPSVGIVISGSSDLTGKLAGEGSCGGIDGPAAIRFTRRCNSSVSCCLGVFIAMPPQVPTRTPRLLSGASGPVTPTFPPDPSSDRWWIGGGSAALIPALLSVGNQCKSSEIDRICAPNLFPVRCHKCRVSLKLRRKLTLFKRSCRATACSSKCRPKLTRLFKATSTRQRTSGVCS